MLLRKFYIIAVIIMFSLTVQAQQTTAFESDNKQYSYALGVTVAQQLKQVLSEQKTTIDTEILVRAIKNVLKDEKLAMDPYQVRAALMVQQKKWEAQMAKKGALNLGKGRKYMEKNAAMPGVKTTASGLQYKVIKGSTGAKPKETDTVEVNYRGTLIDGTEFDSSYKRKKPTTLVLTAVMAGWKEVLQLMGKGAKWEVVIPPQLAYGERGFGGVIGPNETLVFSIELIDIK